MPAHNVLCSRCWPSEASLFLEAVGKFFVGQQQEAPLLEAIKSHLSELGETERKTEEKHNRFRVEARENGSTR